jgi:hypothetical protein
MTRAANPAVLIIAALSRSIRANARSAESAVVIPRIQKFDPVSSGRRAIRVRACHVGGTDDQH